ncbi:MAG: tetratricopeptide repeat protein [Myxococcota bacterium]
MTIDCNWVQQSLFAYLGKELDVGMSESLDSHLSGCPVCQRRLQLTANFVDAIGHTNDLETIVANRIFHDILPEFEKRTPRHRRRNWILLGGIGLASAITATFVWFVAITWTQNRGSAFAEAQPIVPHMAYRMGDVRLTSTSEYLTAGNTIDTGETGQLWLILDEDIVLIRPNSTLLLKDLGRKHRRLGLSRGEVIVDAKPGDTKRTLTIAAPFADVSVIGTRFRVNADTDEIQVSRGVVKISRSHERQMLRSGFKYLGTSGEIVPLSKEDATSIDQALEIPGENRPQQTLVSPPNPPVPQTHARESRSTDRKPHQAAGKPPEISRAANRIRNKSATTRALTEILNSQDCRSLQMLARSSPTKHPDRVERMSYLAECYVAEGATTKARQVYQTIVLSHPDTPYGQNALFEVGRLSEKLGQTQQAKDAFTRYVKDYPRSALAAESLFRTCMIAMQQEEYSTAKQCLQRYQRAYANGGRFAETAFILGQLHKDIFKNDTAAATAFTAALRLGGYQPELSAYWRVFCFRRAGDTAYKSAAADYVQQFPKGNHVNEVKRWLNE